ncbi:MAG TPA: DUF4349 domain-containing protein [Patescibacteria group bacterium]|nr:DUF4349 domain-containing protein [Patescibacteria group bacterium]
MNSSVRLTFGRRFGLLIAVALVVGACGGGALLSTGGDASGDGEAADAPAPPGIEAPVAADETDRQLFTAAEDSAGKGLLIVRTGQLNLEVLVLDDALAAADAAVTAAGGYIAASQRQGDDENASAMVAYRIPVERWETTLASLRKVGAKVLLEQTGSEEVTSQVVDLGARLANLRATESALQAIMAKATRIPDILEVQAQLTSVRGEIEQLAAQKQSLEERAALATLTVGFSLPPTVAVTQVQEGWDPAGEIDRAAATLFGLGQGLANAAIWFAIVLVPLLLVVGLGLGVAWLVVRRLRPRLPAGPVPAGPGSGPAAPDVPAA